MVLPRHIIALAALWVPLATLPQPAAPWPTREIQVVVPFEPGGNMASLARFLADGLTAALPQPAIVVYRSGADGNIGTAAVARAEADGRTILLTGSGMLVAPLLHADAGYDAMRDFAPVARIATAPNVLMVHESLRGITLEQLVKRTDIAFATSGRGQTSHVAAEIFMARTGARWLHVPYRGTGPAVRGLVGGEVQVMFLPAGAVAGAVATGRAWPLAAAHPARLPSQPGVPTLAELGVRGADYSQWYGVFAPAATPAPVLQRLSDLVVRTFQDPAMQQRLDTMGFESAVLPRQEFGAFLATEQQRVDTDVRRALSKALGN